MTARAAFKQGDLRRALAVAKAEGYAVSSIEVNDNGCVLVIGEPGKARKNPLDDLHGK